HRARGYPPSVQFALLGFGETALRHFIYFERPRDVELTDAPEFAPVGEPPAPMTATELPPRPQDFVTQGQLYAGLEDGLRHLAAWSGSSRRARGRRATGRPPTTVGSSTSWTSTSPCAPPIPSSSRPIPSPARWCAASTATTQPARSSPTR